MKTINMCKSIVASIATFVCCGSAATLVGITGDAINSTTSSFGGSIEGTLDDSFAYDPLSPTDPLPDQSYSGTLQNGFHAQEADDVTVVLSYTLSSGPYTMQATDGDFVIDLYGRSGSLQRDDDIEVVLYNGDYATVVSSVAAISIADTAPYYTRVAFDLPEGTTFDRFQVLGYDTTTNVNGNLFTIMEVRSAILDPTVIPEPSATLLVISGLLGCCFQRSRK